MNIYINLCICMQIQIYIHEKGGEYWLQTPLSPSKINMAYLKTNIENGNMIVKAKLNYVVYERVNREQYQCEENTSLMDFTNCAFNELKEMDCSTIINQVI